MFKVYLRLGALLLAWSVSQNASALVFGQLLMGQRTAEFKDKNVDDAEPGVKATEYELGVHVDPIPLVPVSAGLYYLGQTYATEEDGENFAADEFGGSQIGLALMAWSPVGLFNIKPYVKLGYSFMGTYTYVLETTTKIEATYKAKGTHIAIGLRWQPIVFVAGLLEFDMGNETFTGDEVKNGGVKVADIDDFETTVKSTAIRLGVQAGI